MTVHRPRLVVALGCYLASGVGLFFMVVAMDSVLRHPTAGAWAFVLLGTGAWALLTLLTLAWIGDRRCSRAFTGLAVAVAAASLLVLPAQNILDARDGDAVVLQAVGALLIQAIPVLPCLMLAVKVVRFHWRKVF